MVAIFNLGFSLKFLRLFAYVGDTLENRLTAT